MQRQQSRECGNLRRNSLCRTLRRIEKRRRRAIVRAIQLRESWLVAKCAGAQTVEWLHPGWWADNAAAEVERQLHLGPGSVLRHYAMIERRASFLALFNGQPTRRDVLVWELEVYGPKLP